MKTVAIDVAECRLPLPRPIRLGPVAITTRDVVGIRVRTDNGLEGFALGYSRGTPLFQSVAHLARTFLGVSPHDRNNVLQGVQRALVNSAASLVRSLSLFEIGLTDLAAQDASLSLARLLGGQQAHIPVMAVAGYYLAERDEADVVREVADLLEQGYRRVKVMLHGMDPKRDASLVDAVMAVANGHLAADAHWSWNSVAEAFNAFRELDQAGLLFLEDPFGPGQWRLLERLQPLVKTPLAAGEDALEVATLIDIGRSASFLRVDATTCGGIIPAVTALRAAGLFGCEALPHVHTAVHAQIAAACPEVRFVEHIPEACGADPLHLIQARPLKITDGSVIVDDEPGAGTKLDWDAVAKFAVATAEVRTN